MPTANSPWQALQEEDYPELLGIQNTPNNSVASEAKTFTSCMGCEISG